MKNLIAVTVLALLLAPTAVLAQSAFDGTWKIDPAKVQAPEKPVTFVLKDGVYSCITCTPPYSIRADGRFHPVKGHPGFDSASATIVNDRTVRYARQKDGKLVTERTTSVSPDGRTLSNQFTNMTPTGPVTGTVIARRVGKVPAGAHPVSGSWRTQKYSNVSDNILTTTYKVDGNTLHMRDGTGESFDAPMDGSDAPFHGSDTTTSVAVTRAGPRELHLVYKYEGKPVSKETDTLSIDGRTMHIVSHDLRGDTTMRLVASKQSGTTAATAPDGKPFAGATLVSSGRGQTWTFRFQPDGTYRASNDGDPSDTEDGTWNVSDGDKLCLYPHDGATRCFRQHQSAADGAWRVTRVGDPDEVFTVRRQD